MERWDKMVGIDELVKDYTWDDSKVHPAVRYPAGGTTTGSKSETLIAMVDTFNPRTTTPKNVIHSLNSHNQGLADLPHEYYVDITCKPYGSGYAILSQCQHNNRYFDILLQPLADSTSSSYTGNENIGLQDDAWSPGLEVYGRAKVIDKSESYAKESDVPSVTFNCRAMRKISFDESDVEYGDGQTERTRSDTEIALNAAGSTNLGNLS